MSRLTWDEYFINILNTVKDRSSCLSRKVGAIIVKDNRVVATGYNGSPCGIESCEDKGICRRRGSKSGSNLDICIAVHAEENAITQCAKYGISCENAKIYVTTKPCERCMKAIIQSGIKEVIYLDDYNSPLTDELARLSNIKLIKYEY